MLDILQIKKSRTPRHSSRVIINALKTLPMKPNELNNNLTNLPLQQQTMLEPFTSRLGNPVTPGPGNAKELREKMHITQQEKNSESCTEEFQDMIALYLTSGDLTPWQFINCLKAALTINLNEQNNIKNNIRNTLLLIEGNGDD